MDLYEHFKQYRVDADSLPDFLERYTKPKQHRERGEEYVVARIKSDQEDFDHFGYTFITRHDSVTGETVSYYNCTEKEAIKAQLSEKPD